MKKYFELNESEIQFIKIKVCRNVLKGNEQSILHAYIRKKSLAKVYVKRNQKQATDWGRKYFKVKVETLDKERVQNIQSLKFINKKTIN